MIGCTTGARILRPGREFILFKNRDFTRAHFEDRPSLTDRTFGTLGLETWNGEDPEKDLFSGFSIGFNSQLACCDSNVRTVLDGQNYDKLVQAVVEESSTIDQAIEVVRGLVAKNLYCWANMIVVTAQEVAAFEVRDHHVEVDRAPVFAARSNHHIRLGATPGDDDTTTTGPRYQSACDGLKTVASLGEIFSLLRSHEPDPQHSICNHGLYDTVYSYVVHWNEGQTTFYVCQGHPCQSSEYVAVPIQFGGSNDLSHYPSRYANLAYNR